MDAIGHQKYIEGFGGEGSALLDFTGLPPRPFPAPGHPHGYPVEPRAGVEPAESGRRQAVLPRAPRASDCTHLLSGPRKQSLGSFQLQHTIWNSPVPEEDQVSKIRPECVLHGAELVFHPCSAMMVPQGRICLPDLHTDLWQSVLSKKAAKIFLVPHPLLEPCLLPQQGVESVSCP